MHRRNKSILLAITKHVLKVRKYEINSENRSSLRRRRRRKRSGGGVEGESKMSSAESTNRYTNIESEEEVVEEECMVCERERRVKNDKYNQKLG